MNSGEQIKLLYEKVSQQLRARPDMIQKILNDFSLEMWQAIEGYIQENGTVTA